MPRRRILQRRSILYFAAAGFLALISAVPGRVSARKAQAASGAKPPATAKEAAVIDMTGYWVALVNEDWRWRMITPAKGDYESVPLNAEGKRVADTWDPEKDKAEGNECKAYGAGNIMRVPERLHITWADNNTLQIETDAGMQKRLFHFDSSKWNGGQPQLQGDSVAKWEKEVQFPGEGGATYGGPRPGKGGDLLVTTTHMRPGYLRKNGVPYSEDAVLTEYYNVFYPHGPQGAGYLILTSIMDDPQYLSQPFIISGQFERERDGSKWDPTPCRPLWPLIAKGDPDKEH
jgi:hypothetical protein